MWEGFLGKIGSGFSGFTAYQWKNWTTIFSLFCLKGLIGDKHYDMWSDFVQACIIICSRVISTDRLEVADRYLQTFLSKFVSLYGPLNCTPNMHLHLHLKDCILQPQIRKSWDSMENANKKRK